MDGSMDPPCDSGQGQKTTSKDGFDLMPSSKGRQRKKNSKYLDYETEQDATDIQSAKRKTPRKNTGRRGRTPCQKSPKKAKLKAAEGETEERVKTPQGSNGDVPQEPRRKRGRPRKTPGNDTPAKTTPIADGGFQTGGDGVGCTVQQENETPERKYVRKHAAQELEPDPMGQEAQGEPQREPEEELQPGGRRRRGAAKAALKYLHNLAKEVFSHPSEESGSQPGTDSDVGCTEPEPDAIQKGLKGRRGPKGTKRNRSYRGSSPAEDKDFVPDAKEDGEEEEEDSEEMDDDLEAEALDFKATGRSRTKLNSSRTFAGGHLKTTNGLICNIMRTVWDATEVTKKFREEHHSSWVFPEWLPSVSHWHQVPQSDVETYLPQELQSAAFKVSRFGLRQEEPLQQLSRFTAAPPHPEHWDMLLFAGGPVWALEWCPTPDGARATQYVALACHQRMDDQHFINKMYTGPGLVQLWDVGKLDYNNRPDSQPVLAYGLAQDKGTIWHLKWCPAGGWEPPNSHTTAPYLPRLGLLAVASCTGVVTIYSLPHPDALHDVMKRDNAANQQLPIFKAEAVLTLKLGSFKAPRCESSGQVLSLDWLPEKPHNIMAVGFYDGVVGLWDLTTKSTLLRVREADKSLSLLPYRCLLAHDHAVRALAFCPASRYLLATAGEDRYVKTWDLRRLCSPITVQKRFLTNEIFWPMNASGILLAQDNAYTAISSHGVHYFDLSLRNIFAVPRSGTIWSISYTDWLNSVVTSDSLGEVILAVLPELCHSPQYIKRTLERRFPVYVTTLTPHHANKEEMGAGEEEVGEGSAVEQEGGETEARDAGENGSNSENGGDGGRARKEQLLPLKFQTYKEAVKKYYVQLTDNSMVTFTGSEKRAVWKHMKTTESKAKMNTDDLALGALHKVRFSPNFCCHTWLVSGGQTGLVRLHCLRGMISTPFNMTSEGKAQFDALYSMRDSNRTVQTDDL